MQTGSKRTRTIVGGLALAVLASIPIVNAVRSPSADAADAVAGDGTTSATAGASCWGIKQQFPTSTTGIYWLANASMDRPASFHCDMTTDGGGWVLIGRGRDGWTFAPTGQGSPATVRTTVDGPAAFAPAALDTATVNGLLHGTAVQALPDGIRLERSTRADGTTRQDYRIFPKLDRFTWSFNAGQLLHKVVIDGTTFAGSNTYDTATSRPGQTTNGLSGTQGVRRLWTWPWADHGNVKGFAMGTGVNGGSNASTNHLWVSAKEGSPLPFTRVWIRPRIANDAAGFTPLPAEGFSAQAKPLSFGNRPELAPWGVTGLDHTDEKRIEPYSTAVLSLRVAGERVYVGGRFTGVQQGPSGAEIAQPSLAAFDLDGNWIDGFRPKVDGRVWDMVLTRDGKLIIAGDFTSVNDTPGTSGIAALDPRTGTPLPDWKAHVTRADGTRPLVRALALSPDGSTVYAAGSFNRVKAGTFNEIKVSSAVGLSTTTANPGPWRPKLSGSAVRIRASQDGSRILMTGYFNAVNDDPNHGYFGIVDSATGAVVPGIGAWTPSVGTSAKYQQAVADLGDGRVVVGGSEHNIQQWTADRSQLLDAAVTKKGGDTQAIEVFGDRAFIGCHCTEFVYQGTNNYSSPTGFRSVENINLIGMWDTATWEYDASWYPSSLRGTTSEGIWAIDRDARECLWVGGDLKRGAFSGNPATDYLGGFARFCPTDSTPPTAPSALRGEVSGGGVALTWAGSTDASGTVQYDVYRDDRVIATVWGTSYTDPGATGAHRYTVRAVDARGNRSASPAPIAVNGPAPAIATVLPFGATWRYLGDGTDQGTAWRTPDFDDARWPSGPARLGWGNKQVVSSVAPAKPQTLYSRTTFTIDDPKQVRMLGLQAQVATGAVFYVNGVEVGRVNMPTGPITATSPAAGYISGAAETKVHGLAVPGSLLRAGANTLAVELHAMTPGASRGFLDVEATAFASTGDQTPPTAPTLSASSGTPGRVDLTWTASTDDLALGGYLISRDGQPLAVVGPTTTGFVDGAADTAAPHRYEVAAFDTNGGTARSTAVEVGVPADPNLLPFGSTWRWSFTPEGQPNGWQNPSFNDTTWATGPAELGFGDGDEKTLLTTAPKGPWPNTAYFRTTINIPNPNAFTTILATLIRDDGAAIYINGTEVARDNLPAGPLTPATPASSGLSTRGQETAQIPITIPATAFVHGTNTIAVEVHNFDPWSSDLSFDLRLTGQP